MKFALYLIAIFGCATAQFSSTAQTAIVKAHNDLRSAIALGNYDAAGTIEPPAANMRKIVRRRRFLEFSILRIIFRNGIPLWQALLNNTPIHAQTIILELNTERTSIGPGPLRLQPVLTNL